jgi:hyperosmotically inducible protein
MQLPGEHSCRASKILPLLAAGGITIVALAACERPDARTSLLPDPMARSGATAPRAPLSPTTAGGAAEPVADAPRPDPLSRDALSDAVITGKIKAAILTDPGMAGADVSVNTDRGVVSLAGTVRSQEQTAIASAHAQREDGVMRVDNHLAMNLQ